MREVNNALQLQLETAAHLLALKDVDFVRVDEDTDHVLPAWDTVKMMTDMGALVADFPTYWVSPDMCSLIDTAANQLSDDDLIGLDWEHTLFADRGYVVFASPFTNCVLEDPGKPTIEMLGEIIQETYTPVKTFLWGAHPKESWGVVNLLPNAWDDPDSLLSHPSFSILESHEDGYPKWVAHVTSFLLLAQQRVATRTTRQGARQMRRYVQRVHGHSGDVTVVTLRKPYNRTDATRGAIDWDWRWRVSGHWRNQWYASTQTHRPIWIEPHIKGPPNKPFRESRRLFKFIR